MSFICSRILSGTQFETFQVDVTIVPPAQWEVEPATRPGLLADVGLGPIDVLLIPLERLVAEKLHAYTRPYDRGASTRVKDLVDFVLIRLFERLDADRLRAAINDTFSRRATHPTPDRFPHIATTAVAILNGDDAKARHRRFDNTVDAWAPFLP